MKFHTIPNKEYWAVFDVSKPGKEVCVALFLSQRMAKAWSITVKGEYVISRAYAQISVPSGQN